MHESVVPELQKKSLQKNEKIKNYFGSCFVFSSRIFIHFFNLLMRLCSNLAPGTVKSKSLVNWLFIFWKTGSCTVARALRAKDSDAAELKELFMFCEDDIFSKNHKAYIREKSSPLCPIFVL